MSDDRTTITLDEAIPLLPQGQDIHTFRQAGFALIGADHERERLIQAMREAPSIEVTGEQAQSMGHGLAIKDAHGWLFIEARPYAPSAFTAPPSMWPWTSEWWKPSTRRRMLVKAAALILSEIERLDRAASRA